MVLNGYFNKFDSYIFRHSLEDRLVVGKLVSQEIHRSKYSFKFSTRVGAQVVAHEPHKLNVRKVRVLYPSRCFAIEISFLPDKLGGETIYGS